MKITSSLCFPLLLIAFCSAFVWGQGQSDETVEPKETADVVAAKEALAKFGALLKGAQWDALKEKMSDKGRNSLVIEVCYSLAIGEEVANAGGGGLPPGLDEVVRRIDEVKAKYELDDVAKLMFDGDPAKAQKKLEATGKQWEIVGAIWKAQSGSPFHLHPAIGDVEAFEVDGDTIFLDVNMKPIPGEKDTGGADMEIMMQGPPQVVRMKKSGDSWTYDGVDEDRTMAKMQKFMEEFDMQGFGNMDPPPLLDDPSFNGKTFDDEEISLADYKGKIIVLDFWGTWCGPCVAAMPSLKLIREAFKDHGVEIVGIASDEKQAVSRFCKKNKIPWPNVVDAKGSLAEQFGVQAFPTLMVIDKDGKHVHSDIEKKPLVDDLIERLGLDEKDFADLKAKLKKASKAANSDNSAPEIEGMRRDRDS